MKPEAKANVVFLTIDAYSLSRSNCSFSFDVRQELKRVTVLEASIHVAGNELREVHLEGDMLNRSRSREKLA